MHALGWPSTLKHVFTLKNVAINSQELKTLKFQRNLKIGYKNVTSCNRNLYEKYVYKQIPQKYDKYNIKMWYNRRKQNLEFSSKHLHTIHKHYFLKKQIFLSTNHTIILPKKIYSSHNFIKKQISFYIIIFVKCYIQFSSLSLYSFAHTVFYSWNFSLFFHNLSFWGKNSTEKSNRKGKEQNEIIH